MFYFLVAHYIFSHYCFPSPALGARFWASGSHVVNVVVVSSLFHEFRHEMDLLLCSRAIVASVDFLRPTIEVGRGMVYTCWAGILFRQPCRSCKRARC